jgi:pyrroloquinoline quinone (PQQ) biosynthesis protein C
MSDGFYHEMKAFVDHHGAINNPYLDRFALGEIDREEFPRFALEFYQFSRFFPRILVTQLVNTEDEEVAAELTKVLVSELGDGDPAKRHELLYRDFLRSVGIDVGDALREPMLPSTRAYILGMEKLYSSANRHLALGASFGLENMATTMWDHLLPGLRTMKQRWYPFMDMTYFTFHRELENTHEEAMERAMAAQVGDAGPRERRDFREGAKRVLDYLEGFWMGLEAKRSADPTRVDIHSVRLGTSSAGRAKRIAA